jgi:alkylated DNA repair dioxygenase AlkB
MTVQFNFFDGAGDEPERVAQVLEGFRYSPELIGRANEKALVARLRELPFREFEFHGYLGKRRVVSFGWQYDYSQSRLRKAGEIPDFLFELRTLAASFANLEAKAFQQVLVTEYGPGAGIGWHRDKKVFGEVVGISLLTPCVLRFRRKIGVNLLGNRRLSRKWERVNVVTAPRSAYHLSGPARLEWEHSILRVDALRYAITFRTVG